VGAPSAPTGLTALAEPGALEIRWSPSAEGDLASYRVYRAEPNSPPARLAEVPAGTTLYRDETAARGAPYRYTVTAVDQAGNESAPSAPLLGNTP
jgi:fibronectin type 3 domain-containing protein